MLPSKIKLTDEVINRMKSARVAKRIPASALSKAIKRDDSYISSLELGRLRSISSVDFVTILSVLYNIPEDKAIEEAEALIGIGRKPGSYPNQDLPYSRSGYDGNNISNVSESAVKEYRYGAGNTYAAPDLISDMLKEISGIFSEYYRKDPKGAVFALKSFIETVQFDPDFAMDLLGVPFFALKTLSIDERKAVLDDISDVFRKHAAIANSKD